MRKWFKSYYSAILLITILIVAGALLFRSNGLQTGAFLSDTEKSTGSIGQAQFSDVLNLIPGISKAHYTSQPGPHPPVASLNENGLSLDFGEIKAGQSDNLPDVFRIKNLTNEAVKVEFKIDGDVKSLLKTIELQKDNTIGSAQTKRVICKLKTTSRTPKKTYVGAISVYISDTSIKKDIPIRITVF